MSEPKTPPASHDDGFVEDIELRSTPSPGDEDGEIEDKTGLLSGQPIQRNRSRITWTSSLIVSSILAIVLIAGFLLKLRYAATLAVHDALSVATNDYVLDPSWDLYAAPQRREYTWTIRDRIHNPDGIYRPMILVNNQFPGPLIEINEGDTVVVHVHNRAINATSIHWHGLYQNGTNHMDGTVGITQCPIAPGQSFTYEFRVQGQSGTYWWHAHQGVQSSDGVHGPFIIHSRHEAQQRGHDYSSDRVVLLSDHYHDLSSALLWQYLQPDRENAEPVPDSGLINGRNILNCDNFAHRKCDNSSQHVSHAQIDLTPVGNHRVRFINVGAFAEFQLQIDEHELSVTEVDGTDVQPISYHRINISPAQRYSVIVHAVSPKIDNVWLRARMVTQCFTDPPRSLNPETKAIVRYHSSDALPSSIDWQEASKTQCRDLNTTELKPVEVKAAPGQVDAFYYLRSNFEIGAYRLSRGFFNTSSWRASPSSPVLHRVIDGMSSSNVSLTSADGLDAWVNDVGFDIGRELVIQTTGIRTIDVVISNFDDGSHPMHLHGYKFFVLAQGHGYPPMKVPGAVNPENLQPLYDSLDLSNPLRRDTATVEAFGWILIRIVADNPGAWAFHCHLSWHSEAGLVMTFLTRTDQLAALPETNRALCAAQGIDRGMGPSDDMYKDLAR